MTYQDSRDAQIEYLHAQIDRLKVGIDCLCRYRDNLLRLKARQEQEIDRLHAEIDFLRRHCDDISHIKAMRQKEIERLKTPTPDGRCAVCGSYIGDTTYYKITDGKEVTKK